MRIFQWSDELAPDFQLLSDGGIGFFDNADLNNCAIGDLISYHTRLGTTVFEIVNVQPSYLKGYPPDHRRVTAKRLS